MSLALNYCWKEWRAQRGLLVAYTLLVFACLCLGLYLAPRHYWFDDSFGVHALSWFVAAGVIGVVAFVVPALVRTEFTTKDDQFVRRLPGALWPAFWGKLLFLVVAAVTLPLLGLLAGELFVTSLDHSWEGLFAWQWDGTVRVVTPTVTYFSALALLLVPWIWAAGTWTPGGRLAVLATLLLGLLLGVGVYAVIRQSPQILHTHMLTGWLWTLPTGGLIVAAASWGFGRRGGGPWRSARFGLLATSVVIAPFGGWLGNRAMHYHHPDYTQLEQLNIGGITPDERYLLAHVSENGNWYTSAVRIDLRSGDAQQVGGTMVPWQAGIARPSLNTYYPVGRYWLNWRDDDRVDVFDLSTAQRQAVLYDKKRREPVLPDELRQAALQDRIETTPLRDPSGRRVWLDRGNVCYQSADGTIDRVAWAGADARGFEPAGLGIRYSSDEPLFDLVLGKSISGRGARNEYFVGNSLVFQKKGRSAWWLQSGEAQPSPCQQLVGAAVLGLFDARRLLVSFKASKQHRRRLFLFAPDDGEVVDIDVPADMPFEGAALVTPMSRAGTFLERDPDGGIWLQCNARKQKQMCFARIDSESLQVSMVLPHLIPSNRRMTLLSWRDWPEVLVHEGLQIARINIETGERSVVFDGASGKRQAADDKATSR